MFCYNQNRDEVILPTILGCIDLDLALSTKQLSTFESDGLVADKKSFEKWERSNWLSLMIMRRAIPKTFRGTIFKETNARGFLNDLEKRFVKNKKTETSTLLANLVSEIQGQEKRK